MLHKFSRLYKKPTTCKQYPKHGGKKKKRNCIWLCKMQSKKNQVYLSETIMQFLISILLRSKKSNFTVLKVIKRSCYTQISHTISLHREVRTKNNNFKFLDHCLP
jgi:hypothetical protein